MMKWKSKFTAEEAAIFAVGLGDEFNSLKNVDDVIKLMRSSKDAPDCDMHDQTASGLAPAQDEAVEENELIAKAIEARLICTALLDDIWIAEDGPTAGEDIETYLRIAIHGFDSEWQEIVNPEVTRVTKDSLAVWFYHKGDDEKAKLFDPRVIDKIATVQQHQPPINAELDSLKIEISEVRKKVAVLEEVASANFQNWSGSNSSSPLMTIAQKIWDTHYASLSDKEKQPTKEYLVAWIFENHDVSMNQAESLYVVTRKRHGEA